MKRSTCSDNVNKVDCKGNNNCADTKSYDCQYCLDYEACFNNFDDDKITCKGWNATKCPNGIVTPDYSNKNRVDNTKFYSNVVYVNPNDTKIYNCPLYRQFPFSFGFYKLFLFSNKTLRNSLNPLSIIVSDKIEFIMHKIDTIIDVDVDNKYTYALVYPVSMDEIISYADFRNVSNTIKLESVEVVNLIEQVPSQALINLIENNATFVKKVNKLNTTIFKCLSRRKPANNTNSVYIIVSADEKSLNLNISDIVFSYSSDGYFETIYEFDYINTLNYGIKTYAKTNLAFCDDLNTDEYEQRLNMSIIDYFKTSLKQFCYDSLDYKGLYVLDEEYKCLNCANPFIANRKSNGFVGEILNKSLISNSKFIVFEFRPITDETELALKQESRAITVGSFEADFDFNPDFDIHRPRFDLGKTKSKNKLFDYLEFELDIDFVMSGFLSLKTAQPISAGKSFNLKKWKNQTVKTFPFAIPVAGIPVPSNIEIFISDGSADIKCTVANTFELSMNFEKKFNNKYVLRVDNVNEKTSFDGSSTEVPFHIAASTVKYNLEASCTLIVKYTVFLKLNIGSLSSLSGPVTEILEELKQAKDLQTKISEFASKWINKLLPDFILDLFKKVKQKYNALETIVNSNKLTQFFLKDSLKDITSFFNISSGLLEGNENALIQLEDAMIKKVDELLKSASVISGSIGLPSVYKLILATCSDMCTNPIEPFYASVSVDYSLTKEIKVFGIGFFDDKILEPVTFAKFFCLSSFMQCEVDKDTGKCKECSLCPDGTPKKIKKDGKE